MMDLDLEKRIDDRAHVVVGSRSWNRKKDEPGVTGALRFALEFCERAERVLGPPAVSGGTTMHPEKVVMLYWETVHANKIGGIYVSFMIDGFAELEWSDGESVRTLSKLTYEYLMDLDLLETSNLIKSNILPKRKKS